MAKRTNIVDGRQELSPRFTVVVDTKEKKPWEFFSSSIEGTERRHLDTGDYTVAGLETVLCIERKNSASEIAQNIHQPRFVDELERMQTFKYRYIIIECNIQNIIDFPLLEDLPQKIKDEITISGAYILRCLNRIQVKYGVNIIYCGTFRNAQWVATNIMKEVINLEWLS